jgi:hypothetical protein
MTMTPPKVDHVRAVVGPLTHKADAGDALRTS